MESHNIKMIALTVHGTGSKVFQSFFDGHEEIMMIPGYQLLYFYPHWIEWEKKEKNKSWESLCDALFENHPSIFDSRILPGSETLDKLGARQDEWIEIDKIIFKEKLIDCLKNRKINSKNFLEGIHYAYYLCRGEDISKKKVILYHVHYGPYVTKFLLKDFPDLKVITLIRDLRSCLYKSIESAYLKSDRRKLDETDFILLRKRTYKNTYKHYSEQLDCLLPINIKNLKVVKHEDLVTRFDKVIKQTADFIGIKHTRSLYESTFASKVWKSSYYNLSNNTLVNKTVISDDWKKELKKIDWFVLEGLHYDFFIKYYNNTYQYKSDSIFNRIKLFVLITLFSKIEIDEFILLLKSFKSFLSLATKEAFGIKKLKDYSKDAYYRHKWYNINYKLFKQPFYVKNLKYKNLNIFSFSYIFFKVINYFFSILLFPNEVIIRIFNNYQLLFKRIIKKNRVLPEIL